MARLVPCGQEACTLSSWVVNTSSSVEKAGCFVPEGCRTPCDLVLCVSESSIETDIEFGLGNLPLVLV